jgi:hypothetical protein
VQARRHGEHAAGERDVLPEQEHALVAGELLVEGLTHRLPELELDRRLLSLSRRRGRRPGDRGGGRRRLGRPVSAPDADPGDHCTEGRRGPVVDDDLLEDAVGLGLVDHRRLVGLDLDERLAAHHVVARPFEPGQDRRLLHRVGQLRHADLDEARVARGGAHGPTSVGP